MFFFGRRSEAPLMPLGLTLTQTLTLTRTLALSLTPTPNRASLMAPRPAP